MVFRSRVRVKLGFGGNSGDSAGCNGCIRLAKSGVTEDSIEKGSCEF